MRDPRPWPRLPFVDDVLSSGGRAFLVGGAVRDRLLGRDSKDLDVVVGGLDREALGELLSRTGKVSFVGRAFGVFKWTATGGTSVDVALPRTEVSTGPGHRDFDVTAEASITIEDDLARRDFTCNAIAVELPGGRVLDPWNGRDDLDNRVLRAVGDPDARFVEDPLRILRGAGFVARFGLAPDPATRAAMARHATALGTVSAERIATELVKLVVRGERPSDGLRLLVETGAMEHVLPEFLPSVGFEQNHPNHHLKLDEHVYAVLDETARRGFEPVVRVAALFHDIAKPATYTEERRDGGSVHGRTIGHDRVGAGTTAAILERLRFAAAEGFPADGCGDVVALVRHHLIDLEPDSSERAWRRWLHRVGGPRRARLLLDLWTADRVGHREGLDETRRRGLVERLARTSIPPLSQHDLDLDGATLARELGLAGRAIGRVKEALLARVVDGDLPNERDALLDAARSVAGEDAGG